MLAVFNKGGNLLDSVNVDNVEAFMVKQRSEHPGRVAIGVQDNEGKLHIIRTQADMKCLESIESMEWMEDGGEVRGELLMAAPCRRRGYELWKCV